LFTPTAKQSEAIQLFRSMKDLPEMDVIRMALLGGSRSGKTRVILEIINTLCERYPGAWFLVARKHANHAVMSIWMDTLQKVIKPDMKAIKEINNQKNYIKYHNGSMIFVDGLDTADRVEKILGREYAGIFVNEVSQIAFPTLEILFTRLAQQIPGLKPMMFVDFNPPSKTHYLYRYIIQKLHPKTKMALPANGQFQWLKMNPVDNVANLAKGYIEDVLESLGENAKERFLHGNFVAPEGVIFRNYEIIEKIPDEVKSYARNSKGMDFGFTVDPAVVEDLYFHDKTLWIDELVYSAGLTNEDLKVCMVEGGVGIWDTVIADSAEPKSIKELEKTFYAIRACEKGADSVRNGIDWMLSLKKIYITRKSVYTIDEFEQYSWKQNSGGESLPIPEDRFNHGIDAIRYGCEDFMRPLDEPEAVVI